LLCLPFLMGLAQVGHAAEAAGVQALAEQQRDTTLK
jgi:hypothetical protein